MRFKEFLNESIDWRFNRLIQKIIELFKKCKVFKYEVDDRQKFFTIYVNDSPYVDTEWHNKLLWDLQEAGGEHWFCGLNIRDDPFFDGWTSYRIEISWDTPKEAKQKLEDVISDLVK